jgi:hypothetical protein
MGNATDALLANPSSNVMATLRAGGRFPVR